MKVAVEKRTSREAHLSTRPVSRKSSGAQLPRMEEENKPLWILVDKKRKREVVVVGDGKRLRKSLDEDNRALKSLAKAIANNFATDDAKKLYKEDMRRQKAEGQILEYYNERDAETAASGELEDEPEEEYPPWENEEIRELEKDILEYFSMPEEESGSENDVDDDSGDETAHSEGKPGDLQDEDTISGELPVEVTQHPPVRKVSAPSETPLDAEELFRILKSLQAELAGSSKDDNADV